MHTVINSYPASLHPYRVINKYGGLLRRMRRERFNWFLLNKVEMDHKFRAQRVLGAKSKE
eukprot:905586-Pelagomonas_calceolata.AAC.1